MKTILIILLIVICNLANATKNYYWNYGVTFPISKEEVLQGRAMYALEAIRKHTFLLEYPAAGYYKFDYPSAVKINGTWVAYAIDGELMGTVPVYDPLGDPNTNAVIIGNADGTVTKIPYWKKAVVPTVKTLEPQRFYDSATDEDINIYQHGWIFNSEALDVIFQEGTLAVKRYASNREGSGLRMFCDGVLYMEHNTAIAYQPAVGYYYICGQISGASYLGNNPPPAGGYFADKSNDRWVKAPSRNRYAEWDMNASREWWESEVITGLTVNDSQTWKWYYNSFDYFPKQYDVYQQDRPLYRLPEQYLDEGVMLIYGENSLELNKYYATADKSQLYKCTDPNTTNAPATGETGWEFINLWSPDPMDFKMFAEGVPIAKEHFYKEDIQGAVWESQQASNTKPTYYVRQYSINPSLPMATEAVGSAPPYPLDPKFTPAKMAYIEQVFDNNRFYAEVDDEFKENYDYGVGGDYGGDDDPNATAIERFDAAAAEGDVSLIQPIMHWAWGCNESGFEWALKQVGEFVWYFDEEKPYFPNLASWTAEDLGDNAGGGTEEKAARGAVLRAGLTDFINSIQGTWRRTWRYSYGVPQEAERVRPSSYTPPNNIIKLNIGGFATNPVAEMQYWDNKFYIDTNDLPSSEIDLSGSWDGGSETFDYGTYSNYNPSIAANDAATRDRFKPDWQFYDPASGNTIRRWSIDRLPNIINHIWDVLTVDIGYRGKRGTFSTSAASYYGSDTMDKVEREWNTFVANYKNHSYSAKSIVGCRNSWKAIYSDNLDYGYSEANILRVTIQALRYVNDLPLVISPNLRVKVKIWSEIAPEIPYDWADNYFAEGIRPAYSASRLMQIAGDLNYAITMPAPTVTEQFPTYKLDVPPREIKTLRFTPSSDTYIGWYIITPNIPVTFPCKDINAEDAENLEVAIQIGVFPDTDILLEYDWNRVPTSVWFNDMNYPVLTESFELPLRPPYPNPVFWINPPVFETIHTNLTVDDPNNPRTSGRYSNISLSGNVSNATSNPAGRDISYIHRLDTYANLGEPITGLGEYDNDTQYYTDDEVKYADVWYKALQDTQYVAPTIASHWKKMGYVNAWQQMVISDPNHTEKYEYYNDVPNNKYYIRFIDDEPQQTVHLDLRPATYPADYLQDFLYYYNLAYWRAHCKAFDDGGTGTQLIYTHGDPNYILTGITEIVVPEDIGLDLGAFIDYTPNYADPNDPNEIVSYDIDYRWKWGYRNVSSGTARRKPTESPVLNETVFCYDTYKLVVYASGDPNVAASWQDAANLPDDNMLDYLSNNTLYGYEPNSLKWNDWQFQWNFLSSDAENLPESITEATEANFEQQKFRAVVDMAIDDVEHTFFSGWVSIIPAGGLDW